MKLLNTAAERKEAVAFGKEHSTWYQDQIFAIFHVKLWNSLISLYFETSKIDHSYLLNILLCDSEEAHNA